ncbi:hypothetical protein [Nocardia crassostreae]|uniref:hypothetical protein n=1 Tax=Nocardia crassostreae TaxID=53428 RepID=UPI000A3E6358|nr:hypothetical protein [Nocardia crassostreae]
MADEHRGTPQDPNDQSGEPDNVAPGGHFGAHTNEPAQGAHPPLGQPAPPATGPTTPFAGPPAAPPATPPAFQMPMPPVEPTPSAFPAPPKKRRGSIIQQEPGVTAARVPTVAEARARAKARYLAEEKARVEAEADAAKRKSRKRLMVGGAAVVGVAALVGGGYLAYSAIKSPEVTAYCTIIAKKGQEVSLGNGKTITATQDNQEIVVPDNYCADGSRSSGGGIGGIFILNGLQYRYYYGGANTIGQTATGGTTVAPKGASIKTKTGTTIQRGGLGAKLGGGGS